MKNHMTRYDTKMLEHRDSLHSLAAAETEERSPC